MAQLSFLVAKNDINGVPGLEKGAPVIKVAHETIEHYEYVVWHRIDDGGVAKTRIEHLGEFITCEVDGVDIDECHAKAMEMSSGIAYKRGGCDDD